MQFDMKVKTWNCALLLRITCNKGRHHTSLSVADCLRVSWAGCSCWVSALWLKGNIWKKLKSDLNLKFFLNIFLISAQGMDLSLFFSDVMVSSRMGPLQKRFYLLGAYYDIERVPPTPGWANVITKLHRFAPLSGVLRSQPRPCLSDPMENHPALWSDDTFTLWRRFCVADLWAWEEGSHQAINLTVVVSFTAITSTCPATL